jgi:hypothetical protein
MKPAEVVVHVKRVKTMTEIRRYDHSSLPFCELLHKPRPPNELGVKNNEWRAHPLSMGAVEFPAQARFHLTQATQVVMVIQDTVVACTKQGTP